jgi:hypothetical protein
MFAFIQKPLLVITRWLNGLDWFSKVRAAKGDFWGIEVGTGGNLTCQSDNSDSIRFTSVMV